MTSNDQLKQIAGDYRADSIGGVIFRYAASLLFAVRREVARIE